MKVRVILDKWGNHSKDDELDLPESTAKACIKAGAVECLDKEKKSKK